jgi:hypothetical protein
MDAKRATLRDVAAAAGVSRALAGFVLGGLNDELAAHDHLLLVRHEHFAPVPSGGWRTSCCRGSSSC